jgi:DNA polymerase|tara:strand:- start:29342 stop:30115 length:774 start_codon:yes stop_codon:yes gene_type:complete
MESVDYHQAVALLRWQIELGATEAIGDVPVNRYEVPASLEKPRSAAAQSTPGGSDRGGGDAVAEASRIAAAAQTLEALQEAISTFEHCELKRGARRMVFADGTPGARLMIVGEAPGRDEDREGRPFAGQAGQLLDKMLAAINMGRDHPEAPVYLATVLPWRPPQDRDPRPEEIAMMKPFLMRHIALAKPEVLVLAGNGALQVLLGKRGIARLRGQWTKADGIPALPMFHPAYLLRSPEFKRETWVDLLTLKARLAHG